MSSQENMNESLQMFGGKHLTFCLGDESYGFEILKVQEIIGLVEVTSVPKSPEYVRGVINLRGKIIPVVDLRKKFQMPATEDTEKTCVIVVQLKSNDASIVVGLIVDEVSEVIEIAEDQIEPAPDITTDSSDKFIKGMGKVNEKVIMLLDVDKVVSAKEISMLAK